MLHATVFWRSATAVVFDRAKADQVMLEVLDWDDPTRGGYYKRNREFLGQAQPLESCLHEDPIQVMFTGTVEPMRQAELVLRQVPFRNNLSMDVTVYEDRDFSMLDVIHPAISKGATLAEWAGVRGVTREDILAIGDNHNDLEMLSFAGVPVVMGNSVPELKERGWHVTRSNDEDGVAAAIERFVLQEAAEWK